MSEDHTTTDYQPGRDLFVSTDRLTHWQGCDAVHSECAHPAVAILRDLIAELRDEVHHYPPDLFRDFTDDDPASQSRTPDRIAGVAMRHAWTRAGEMADRAEARLREVTA